MYKRFLGIEYSCDDTSIAVVSENKDVIFEKTIRQNHAGGVIPEIAARQHLNALFDVVRGVNFDELDGIAATFGPGLVSSLMLGTNFAKGLAITYNLPLYSVNHLEAHMLSVSLTEQIVYPYLCLLVSGGHTQIVIVKSIYEFETIGRTIDDALGECFDKVAKSMNMPYPGGPAIEECAKLGNPNAYRYTRPLHRHEVPNFSFSGLKTQVIRSVAPDNHSDVAASFTKTICDSIEDKLTQALKLASQYDIKHLSVGGGVAANSFIRARLMKFCASKNLKFVPVDKRYCMDNGAMIAWAGLLQRKKANLDDSCFTS